MAFILQYISLFTVLNTGRNIQQWSINFLRINSCFYIVPSGIWTWVCRGLIANCHCTSVRPLRHHVWIDEKLLYDGWGEKQPAIQCHVWHVSPHVKTYARWNIPKMLYILTREHMLHTLFSSQNRLFHHFLLFCTICEKKKGRNEAKTVVLCGLILF